MAHTEAKRDERSPRKGRPKGVQDVTNACEKRKPPYNNTKSYFEKIA
jgi:hypothetical protein